MTDCPFCHPDAERLFLVTSDVIGLWDAFPVSGGHALIVPKRHVASWFEATAKERVALTDAIEIAKREIEKHHAPDGYNVGINIGAAAGQTIFHLHVHVIPRYEGDVAEPRGGVRGVIPSKRNYLARTNSDEKTSKNVTRLVHGGDDEPFLPHLTEALARASSVDIAVAFTLRRGVELILPHLEELLSRGGRLRYLTGDYRDATDPDALATLLDLEGNRELRVFETAKDRPLDAPHLDRAFHPKAYIIHGAADDVAFVGSSNLSESALRHGIEWNYRISSDQEPDGFAEIAKKFEHLFIAPGTTALTDAWIDSYSRRRASTTLRVGKAEIEPEPLEPAQPHPIQSAALEALERTREEGNRAGLVVLATGLGKTWLSAFDTNRPEFERVLFVAHREEILQQARHTFRRVRPAAHLGLYNGTERDPNAEVLFASVQTLGRQRHLERFRADEFDYIVVDEFHHASAPTYRRLIEYFQPRFFLGLTATPERSDGGNLLALCNENLVFRCDLADGIRAGLLSPFHYFGVPDDVDYRNIPWRSGRFDEEALTNAVATQRRAENSLEQWRRRGSGATLAFCVSVRHARFMADFFSRNGLRAVAVHSGEDSAPRTLSLERLGRGELDVVCAVDMFNEGVDVPAIQTVMMLRPTESRILWLQQLGRGLRKAEGKDHLRVIDYIGNHRSFLMKPQTLFDLQPGAEQVLNLLERYETQSLDLPPGCEVVYDLETIEILRKLVQPVRGEVATLQGYYEEFRELNGVRPSASETFHDGYNPRIAGKSFGSWHGLVREAGNLDEPSRAALQRHAEFLRNLETTPMEKSYKMVTLLAMLNSDAFPGTIAIDDLVAAVSHVVERSATLSGDFGGAETSPPKMRRLLEENPIRAWAGGKGTGGRAHFAYEADTFRTTFDVAPEERAALQELVREIVDWRVAEYLARPAVAGDALRFVCAVKQSNGRPMIFLPDRAKNPNLPSGTTRIVIDGKAMEGDFVKIALNTVRRESDGNNELPQLLRSWFGPDAGQPGTRHSVVLETVDGEWQMRPEGRIANTLQLWRSYSREQIPPLFGMEFSTAIWNVGYVARSNHVFLLVTLDKSGHTTEFKYGDHFLDSSTFEWQSQNRTSREGRDGQLIRDHESRGVPIHLFVRPTKKNGAASAPFVYCGDVRFIDWEGDRPVTVRFALPDPVPERLRATLRVPAPVLPFRDAASSDRPYDDSVPLVSLNAAAGAFSEEQLNVEVLADAAERWITWDGHPRFTRGMFVARVTGRSMEPEIPDGSFVLFRPPAAGSRDGRRVLVRAAGIEDSETGGEYTVKVYSSEKVRTEDGSPLHTRIILKPLNPEFEPIVLGPDDEGHFRVVADFVAVVR